MMDQGDNRCIIHILNGEGDFQGCGYLFNGRYAITSGSVIRKCLGCESGMGANLGEREIMVSLPFGSDGELRPCRIVYCNCGRNRLCDSPQNQEHPVDLALIEFLRPFVFRPGSKLADVNGADDVRVRLLDFTNDREPGKPLSGQVDGEVEAGIKKLGFDGGSHEGVRPGYSGAPVFNTDDGTCIGLQIDLPADLVKGGGGEGTCCLLPAATILKELDAYDIEGRYPVRRNPYMGPRPFEAGNQRDFYGRATETERLVAAVDAAPVVPVIGTAGIGKTSLVQAGLVGSLSEGEWVAVRVEAAADIEERIIDALLAARDGRIDSPDMFDEAVESGKNDRGDLVAALQAVDSATDGSPLVTAVRRTFNSEYFPEEGGVPKVLLFIDDLERIFDERVPVDVRDRLFRLLEGISRDGAWRESLRVVFALRSESYDSYMEQGSAAESLAGNEVKIFKLNREKTREIITVPAEKLSVKFEDGLVDMMLIDWENERQPLATLQLVLRQLWPRQRKYQIRTGAYREVTADGGLAGLSSRIVSKTNGHHPVTAVREEGRALRRDEDFTPVKYEIPGEEAPARTVAEPPVPPVAEARVDTTVEEPVVESPAEPVAKTTAEVPVEETKREAVDSILFSDEDGKGPVDLTAAGPRSGKTAEDKKKTPHRFDEESGRVNKVPTAATDSVKATVADGDEIPDEDLDFSGDPAFDVTVMPVSSEKERAERIASRAADIQEARNPDTQLATLLAVEAARVDSNLTTNSVLRECIRHLPRAVHTFKQTHTIWSTVFSSNGRMVATAGGDRSARVYDLETGNELHCINHKDIIRYVAFSSNDCLVASVSSDGVAIVTNVETGDRICRIEEPTKIHGMAFSKDGRMLALSSYTSAKVYRVDTGEEVLHSRHGDKIYAVAFSDDTSLVATASHDGKIKIFRLRSATEIASFEHRDWVINITFSPDNTLLASASGDKTARVWRIGTGEEVCRVRHDDWVRAVVFNHDGRFIATAGGDHTASVWYVNIGKEVCRVIHDDWVRAVAFSPDGNLLATSSRDGTAKITEIQTSKTVLRIHHNGSVNTARFNADGSLVGTASSDGTARICPLVSSEGVCKVDHSAAVNGLAFSPDGSLLTTYGADRGIKLTRVATNELVRTITAEDHQSVARASSDGRLVAVGCGSGVVAVHDVESGERICRTQLDSQVTSLCFNRDNSVLAAGAANGNLVVLEIASGKQLNRMSLEARINVLAFDDSGKFLALGLESGLTLIYRIARELEIFRVKYKDAVTDVNFNFKSSLLITAGRDGTARVSKVNGGNGVCMVRHDGPVNTAVISVNNKHIVTASDDGTARIWRIDTGTELFRIQHEGPVTAASFHSEGSLVITASRDGSSKVCLATTGEELCQINHDGEVTAAVFNGEGTRIATAGADGIAKVSYRFTIDLMREARRRLTRNFSQAEWQRYFGHEPYRTTVPWLPDGQ